MKHSIDSPATKTVRHVHVAITASLEQTLAELGTKTGRFRYFAGRRCGDNSSGIWPEHRFLQFAFSEAIYAYADYYSAHGVAPAPFRLVVEPLNYRGAVRRGLEKEQIFDAIEKVILAANENAPRTAT